MVQESSKKYDSVMFVEATPESILRRRVQEIAKRNGVKVKVVERVGCTVKKLIQKSKPFEKKKCERVECVLCKMESNVDCRSRGCVYSIKCKECDREYRGQTGRTIYDRTKEHKNDWKKKMDR